MEISNIERLANAFVDQDSIGLTTKYLGNAAGSKRVNVNIDTVPPGAYSAKYHSHSQQEEFFLILSGSGLLRLDNVEYDVEEGDFFAKPAAQNLAHTFYNSSKTPLVILDISTKELEDTVFYPDEKIYLQKSNGERFVFRAEAHDKHWSSDPNHVSRIEREK